MKRIDIINAVNVLGRVRIHKIQNEKVKFSLLRAYRTLRKASREIDDYRKDVIEGFQRDFQPELEDVQQLRCSGRPVTGHDAFLKAESDANRHLQEMLREEVTGLAFDTIPFDDFVKAVKDEDLTCEDIAVLDGIILE